MTVAQTAQNANSSGKITEPGRSKARSSRHSRQYLVLKGGALLTAQKQSSAIDGCQYQARINLNVGHRWRALVRALSEVGPSECLRIEQQRVDFYYEIHDAMMQIAGQPLEARVRCQVRTPNDLVFWVPRDLCKPAPASAIEGFRERRAAPARSASGVAQPKEAA